MSSFFDWNGLLMSDKEFVFRRLSQDEVRKYELSRFEPGDENGHGIRLYVGEIRTERFCDVYEYKVFPTFEKAAEWCLHNTQYRKFDENGVPCTLDAYDWRCVVDRTFYGDKSKCRHLFYYNGFFSIRTITVL